MVLLDGVALEHVLLDLCCTYQPRIAVALCRRGSRRGGCGRRVARDRLYMAVLLEGALLIACDILLDKMHWRPRWWAMQLCGRSRPSGRRAVVAANRQKPRPGPRGIECPCRVRQRHAADHCGAGQRGAARPCPTQTRADRRCAARRDHAHGAAQCRCGSG
eukprot:4788417-Pyramimonas_sp.AAC.1